MKEKIKRKIRDWKETYILTSKSKIARILLVAMIILVCTSYLVSMFFALPVIQPTVTLQLLGVGILILVVVIMVYAALLLNGQETISKDIADGLENNQINLSEILKNRDFIRMVKKAVDEISSKQSSEKEGE